jgi:hypothetical protein
VPRRGIQLCDGGNGLARTGDVLCIDSEGASSSGIRIRSDRPRLGVQLQQQLVLYGRRCSRFRCPLQSSRCTQPPPRRRYGRPNYSSGNTNKDGSQKYTFLAGMGLASPIGNTHKYETPSYGFQFGGGRNFNKVAGLLLQFDYDHFGLQGATLANQNYLYDYGCPAGSVAAGICGVSGLDGNNHVWSFTLNPTFTLPTEGSLGAYAVVGVGFYHKVTNFTEPTVEESCYYYCEEYQVNANIDHYTSNAVGVNGGFGLTYKISKFSNERFYMEARYVYIPNSQRYGVTASSPVSVLNSYTGYNLYPQNSNRTTYIPVKFGIRF